MVTLAFRLELELANLTPVTDLGLQPDGLPLALPVLRQTQEQRAVSTRRGHHEGRAAPLSPTPLARKAVAAAVAGMAWLGPSTNTAQMCTQR